MDRQAVLGFVMIFILLVVWMWMNAPPPPDPSQAPTQTQEQVAVEKPDQAPPAVSSAAQPESPGKFFEARTKGRDRYFVVETDLYRAEIWSKGGRVKSWEFKKYNTWFGAPVQLVDYEHGGDLSLLFQTSDGKRINTRDLYFDILAPGGGATLNENNFEFEIILRLPAANGGYLQKSLAFRNDTYALETSFRFVELGSVIANFEYQIVWESGLLYAEHNSVDESSFASAFAYAGKELTEVDASAAGDRVERDMGGVVDWVAARTKYFAVALIPTGTKSEGAYIEGTARAMPDNGLHESYLLALKMPFKGESVETSSFRVYLGPLDISLVQEQADGLDGIMSLGWAWVIRPIAQYIMLPLFNVIHMVIPNWGLVIIVFTVIIKLALHPLTKTQLKSMKKMQALQPMMEELRAKHKDDPQKMNQAIMNLYKEYGVNPAGGCLPLLLQLPILYALFVVFRAHIDLRQASFVGWITDLSVPDIAFSLPFHLPLFGIQDVSGIALLMGITMFVQQKMTIKDPRQKAMVWMMPIMMTLLFNSFPSGLNLYYTVFNMLAIVQQVMTNKQDGGEPLRKPEPKKRKPGGLFGKLGNIPRLKK